MRDEFSEFPSGCSSFIESNGGKITSIAVRAGLGQ